MRLRHVAGQTDRASELHVACESGLVESVRAMMDGGAAIDLAMVSYACQLTHRARFSRACVCVCGGEGGMRVYVCSASEEGGVRGGVG